MTVAENMGFALRMLGVGRAEVEAKVRDAAATLRLTDLLDRKPRQLSGGQRQRVAIGRAITRSPEVFLFDEPLSNLDADLRAQMRIEIARLHNELETTMIYVTHDQLEAMTLADRIVVLNGGRIEQAGPPLELYERPRNRFVAGFLGQPKMNFIRAEAVKTDRGTELKLPGGQSMKTTRTGIPSGEVVLGIRPDVIVLGASGLRAMVSVVERLGGSTLVHASVAGLPGLIAVELPGKPPAERGSHVDLVIDPSQVYVFNGDGLAQY
jgi:multiple sugar transport system ATP-binding protein